MPLFRQIASPWRLALSAAIMFASPCGQCDRYLPNKNVLYICTKSFVTPPSLHLCEVKRTLGNLEVLEIILILRSIYRSNMYENNLTGMVLYLLFQCFNFCMECLLIAHYLRGWCGLNVSCGSKCGGCGKKWRCPAL